MAQQSNVLSTIKWKLEQQCEIYSTNQKRWITGEVIDVFTDDEGPWLRVKYGRIIQEMSPNDEHLRAISSDENTLKWDNVVEAVKQELYPMISSALGQSVNELMEEQKDASHAVVLKENDLSEDAVGKVIDKLKTKRMLYSNEIEYIRDLVKRANVFRWEETESMFLIHSLFAIQFVQSGNTVNLH